MKKLLNLGISAIIMKKSCIQAIKPLLGC